MATLDDKRLWISSSEPLVEGAYLRINVSYAGNPTSVIVFRHKGECLAYRNQCVHMPRELDDGNNKIFDETGQYLRCSMHGIVYDPQTGESISALCNGEQLTPVKIMEDEEGIWIKDKRVKALILAE